MEPFQFETSFGRYLAMGHTSLFRHLGKLLKEKNLPITPEQFSVLTHLWRNDGLQQSEIATCTNRNRANVTRIIDILEREGLVKRQDDPHDRRVFRIYLTARGKQLKKDAAKCAEQSIKDGLQGVSPAEKAVMVKVLKKIIENVG